eukprot:6441650-Ditylum_brightwellii.AAC.1
MENRWLMSGKRNTKTWVGLAECEEIYIAASRRMEKQPKRGFGKQRVLGATPTILPPELKLFSTGQNQDEL